MPLEFVEVELFVRSEEVLSSLLGYPLIPRKHNIRGEEEDLAQSIFALEKKKKMMRMKTRPTDMSPKNGSSHGGGGVGGDGSELVDWELRPGGMLVQKRNPDSDRATISAPTIRLRVKHGHAYHEIYISSQASFGELKKMLSAPTGLHPQDQKLLFKDKERDSKTYLDFVGVKDRSKIVLVEDATSQEKRFLEMRRTAVMEKASKSISEISLEVDKLASKVAALESIITKGKKVAETDVLNLIELLMNQLIKLDGIIADGDVKLQRRMQVKRVQKYVETLDMLKIKNAMPPTNTTNTTTTNGGQTPPIQPRRHSTAQIPPTQQVSSQQHHHKQQQQQPQSARRTTANGSVAQTNKWETFEPPALIQFPSSSTTATTTTTTPTPANKLNWEFFD